MRRLLLVVAAMATVAFIGCEDQPAMTSEPGSAADARAGEVIRPIGDFVAAQGTFCFPDGGGGCLLFVPPLENFVGWFDPAAGYVASMDYAGIGNAWLMDNSGGAVSLGTSFAGTVVERPLPDGRAEVTIVLHTSNALTWASSDFDFNGPLVFGARAPDVLAGANPALGNCRLEVTFINTAPGAPLPDLLQILAFPEEGQEVHRVAAGANVSGELREAFGVPDGTPGRVIVNQRGLLGIPGQGNGVADGFPAELVKLRPIGHSAM